MPWRTKEIKWQTRMLTATVIVTTLYLTIGDPNAVSPTIVGLLGSMLALVRLMLGVKNDNEDDDNGESK